MNIKKTISDLLCSTLVGKTLITVFHNRIPTLRNPGYRFSVPVRHSSPVIHASIFWGIYESAEIRLIKKHLRPDLPVIELGGSLGVISSFIIRKLNKNASLLVVEANPHLTTTIQKNIDHHNEKKVSFFIVNKAIGYTSAAIYLNISNDNTASYITDGLGNKEDAVEVECTQLSQIIPSEPFVLVCDIEGSEVEILLYDKEAMRYCSQLFIELHNATHKDQFYSREALLNILIEDGFLLKNRDGNVYFFERN